MSRRTDRNNSKNQRKDRNTSSKGRSYDRDAKDSLRSKTNDPSWYALNPALIRDAASIPFSWAVGTPIDLSNPLYEGNATRMQSIPGICTIDIVPGYGRALSPSDPINVAATSIYSFIRHANSGHSNYDSPDLMLYLMAMSQVYSYINFLQRIYGCATLYAQRNRYLPDALLQCQGVDVEDLRTNLANFRYGINILIDKAASLAVPSNMSIFYRHAFLFQNVYVEGSSIKDQLYLMNPAGFHKFTLEDETSAGMLEYTSLPYMTVDNMLHYGSDMLARIIQSEDMNIMSGDILKAYGTGGILKLASLSPDYRIVPVNDPLVLSQFKNATAIYGELKNLDIKQDSSHGWLTFCPSVWSKVEGQGKADLARKHSLKTLMEKRILSVDTSDPTPELVIEATRLMAVCDDYWIPDESVAQAVVQIHFGSEIATNARMWYYVFDDSGSPTLQYVSYGYETPALTTSANSCALALRRVSMLNMFKFHPAMHTTIWADGSSEGTVTTAEGYLAFDVDNYAVLDCDVVKRMHEAALLNQFSVNSIARV